MTTTLGLTISETCEVVMPLDATAVPEAALLSVRSTCWMTTLLPALPTRAPTKPPAKPMAAASTSATALRTMRPPLRLRRFFGGLEAAACGSGPAGGGVVPPLPVEVSDGRAGAGSL